MIIKLISIFILLINPIAVLADSDEGFGHMMDWYPMGGWGFAFVPFFWIIIVGGIVFFIAKGMSGKNIQSPPGEKIKSALDILKERYAKGEITKEQFETMRKDIEK